MRDEVKSLLGSLDVTIIFIRRDDPIADQGAMTDDDQTAMTGDRQAGTEATMIRDPPLWRMNRPGAGVEVLTTGRHG